MSFLDSYNKYLTIRGGSTKGSMVQTFINETSRLMKTSPSYFEVKINDNDFLTPVLIVDDSKTEDLKHITLAPGCKLKRGDYIQWDEKTWLTLITDHQGDIYYRGRIAECAVEYLKWVDENDIVHSYPCVFHYGAKANFGVFSDKVLSMPDGRRQVIVQKNEHTEKIVRDMRFMFGGNVFKVIDHDHTSEDGLVHFNLKDDLFNPARDNKELGIADYYKSIVDYEIEILNGSIELQLNDSLPLDIVVKRDGEVISAPSITYKSSDPSVATVDDTGKITAISEGVVEIYVQYQSAQSSITVQVVQQLSDKFSIAIESTSDKPNEIKKNQTKDYYARVYNNGILAEESVSFKLLADDHVSETNIAIIKEKYRNGCKVLNNNVTTGTVILSASLDSDPKVTTSISIQMKSLF